MTPAALLDGTENSDTKIIINIVDVGQLVRSQRHQQKLRIDDAAALTGVSVDLFSRLENGKGAVRVDKLLKVLDAMGLCMVVAPKNSPIVREIEHRKTIVHEWHTQDASETE